MIKTILFVWNCRYYFNAIGNGSLFYEDNNLKCTINYQKIKDTIHYDCFLPFNKVHIQLKVLQMEKLNRYYKTLTQYGFRLESLVNNIDWLVY